MRAAAVGDHDELSDVAPILGASELDGRVDARHALRWAGFGDIRVDGVVQEDHVAGLHGEIQVGYGEFRPALRFGSDVLSAVIIGERTIRVHGGTGEGAGQRPAGGPGRSDVGGGCQARVMYRWA